MAKTKNTKSRSHNPAGRPKDPEKYQAIIDAAEGLFLDKGYELTSMDAVAKSAGVSKLTVYSHFADKDALFKASIERKCEHYNMPQTFMGVAHLPVAKALHIIAHNFLTLIYSKEAIRMHRIIEAEASRHPNIAELFYEAGPQRVKKAFEELLLVWIKTGTLAIPDVPRAMDHFFSLLKGECHFLMLIGKNKAPAKKEMDAHIASCLHMFLSAYKA